MNVRTNAIRNTLFSSVGIYTEYLLGMLTSIFIARHLGPEDFGAYSAVIWMVAMSVAMTNSGTASAVIKFVAELRGAEKQDQIAIAIAYLRRAQRWFLLAVLVIGGLLLYFAGNRIIPGFNHVMMFGFLVIAVSLRSQYMFNVGIAKGFENFRATAIIASVVTPLNLGMVVFAWWVDGEVEALLVVFLISSALFYAVSQMLTSRMIPPPGKDVVLPEILLRRVRRHMRLVAVTVTVGFLAASEVEVFFLNMFGTAHAAGMFKVAYQLAVGAAMLVPGVVGALMLPMMANALSQGRDIAGQRFVASTSYLAMLAAPLVAFGVVFSAPIIGLLYGAEYAAAAPAFAICLFACSLAMVTQGGSSLLVSADRQLTILVMVVGLGVLKILLDVVLIRAYGLHGAVLAYVVVAIINAVAITILALRTIGLHPDWVRLLRITIAAGLAALAALPLRGHWPSLPTLLAGGVVIASLYALLTLLLRCWSSSDIMHLQQLLQRYAHGRPNVLMRLLEWSGRKASRQIP